MNKNIYFRKKDEIEQFYNPQSRAYSFRDNRGNLLNVVLCFDFLNSKASIVARNVIGSTIICDHLSAYEVYADSITANSLDIDSIETDSLVVMSKTQLGALKLNQYKKGEEKNV